jgi:DNA-binding winged helix-turn-helix (wHTH) protein/TolB-like protein
MLADRASRRPEAATKFAEPKTKMIKVQPDCGAQGIVFTMPLLWFDAFTLDPTRGAVLRDGVEIELRTQSFAVLSHLASHAGRLVSKDELFDAIWGDTEVTEDSLVQCITEIRKALGDADHRIIKTVRGKGYRFVADISPVAPAPQAVPEPDRNFPRNAFRPTGPLQTLRRPFIALGLLIAVLAGGSGWLLWNYVWPRPPVTLTMMAVPSIVVLPFTNAHNGSSESGGEGTLPNEIATQLRRVPRGFRIVIRSAAAYKDKNLDSKIVGRDLDVRYIVHGAMRRDGGAARVNLQLIEAESGRQLWAAPFDYQAGEADAQNLIAARIARLLTERLLAAESKRPLPAKPEADHYAILGRAVWAGERDAQVTLKAMALFKQGLDLNPNSVPALQGYARAKISAVLSRWAPEDQRSLWLDEAEAAIDRVIAQERRSYGAYRLRGSLFRARGDWEQAIKAFERALDLNSDYAEAHAELGRVKIELGLPREAIADIDKAIVLSPTDSAALFSWHFWAGEAALHAGDYKTALHRLLQAQQANRADHNILPWLAVAYAGLEQEGKGRALMAEYLRKTPGFTLATWDQDNPRDHAVVGAQRDHIASTMKRLGVPEGKMKAASTP